MFTAAVLVVLHSYSDVVPPLHKYDKTVESVMNSSCFRIKVAKEPDTCVVSLAGDVDYAASLELGPQLADIAEHCNTDLLFDLENVTLLDSEGIKTLIGVSNRMHEKQAEVRVIKCSPSARRVLQLIGVDKMLGVSAG